MSVLFLQNAAHEDPGIIADLLDRNNIRYDILELNDDTAYPEPDNYKAIIILGGPYSANDINPKTINELAFIKTAFEQEIPLLGICLGFQMLARAAGGEVVKSPVKEIGWYDDSAKLHKILLTDDGINDPLFADMPKSFPIFHIHGETIVLNDKMTLLATGQQVENQAVRVGKCAYGIQGHFELTRRLLERWYEIDIDLKKLDKDKVYSTYIDLEPSYLEDATRFFKNFFRLAGLID